MNEEEMDYIAERIASRLISFMEHAPKYNIDGPEDEEQEEYRKMQIIQNKIKRLQNKLK